MMKKKEKKRKENKQNEWIKDWKETMTGEWCQEFGGDAKSNCKRLHVSELGWTMRKNEETSDRKSSTIKLLRRHSIMTRTYKHIHMQLYTQNYISNTLFFYITYWHAYMHNTLACT